MNARFIVRLDDACPTYHKEKWDYLEKVLDKHSVSPIVAVVPNNLDPELICDEVDINFWDKVKGWEQKGWIVAMHGYQHQMYQTDADMVLPFYKRSEFAGLSLEQQSEKIRKSWEIFQQHDVTPSVWIAPAHCFDLITLESIYNETSIRIVSDGIARDQFYEHGFYWIPQQLWNFEVKKSGLWTVCLHPNTMTYEDLTEFDKKLAEFCTQVTNISAIKLTKRPKSLMDNIENWIFWTKRRLFAYLGSIRRKWFI